MVSVHGCVFYGGDCGVVPSIDGVGVSLHSVDVFRGVDVFHVVHALDEIYQSYG